MNVHIFGQVQNIGFERNGNRYSSFFISLVELDEFSQIKLSKIGRLDQGLNPDHLHKSQALKCLLCLCETVNGS